MAVVHCPRRSILKHSILVTPENPLKRKIERKKKGTYKIFLLTRIPFNRPLFASSISLFLFLYFFFLLMRQIVHNLLREKNVSNTVLFYGGSILVIAYFSNLVI